MYPTGWKTTSLYEANSTSISEFATGLEAPTELIIPCEGFTFCLLTLGKGAGNTATGADVLVWGTQTDGEAAQQIKFCFNSKLCQITTDAQDACDGLDINIPGIAETLKMSLLTVTDQDSGLDDNPADDVAIGALHFWNRLAGNQTVPGYMDVTPDARSADDPNSTYLWHYGSRETSTIAGTGPSWMAVPCGPFNYLQLEVSDHSSDQPVIFYNLLT